MRVEFVDKSLKNLGGLNRILKNIYWILLTHGIVDNEIMQNGDLGLRVQSQLMCIP